MGRGLPTTRHCQSKSLPVKKLTSNAQWGRVIAMTKVDLNDVSMAHSHYRSARNEMINTAIAAHLDGESANNIARKLDSVSGLSRPRILEILAVGRRVAATQQILDDDDAFHDLHVHGGEPEEIIVHLVPRSTTPLGAEAAHRLWIALAQKGLTIAARIVDGQTINDQRLVDASDPEAALARLADVPLFSPDFVDITIVNLPSA